MFTVHCCYAQDMFEKYFQTQPNYLYGNGILTTLDSCYVFSFGQFTGSVEYTFLVKTNYKGDTLWVKKYNQLPNMVSVQSVIQLADSNFVLTGYGGSAHQVILLKVDKKGDVIWCKMYGNSSGQSAESVLSTSDGGLLINGADYAVIHRGLLMKTDAIGDTLWVKTNDTTCDATFKGITEFNNGGYAVTGNFWSNVTIHSGIYLEKLNNSGDTLWTKVYSSNVGLNSFFVKPTIDGGCILFGELYTSGQYDLFVLKTDSVGNAMWARSYGGINDEHATDIKPGNDGGYILCGYTNSFGNGNNDGYLLKIDSIGDLLWSKTYGGTQTDNLRQVCEAIDNGYVAVGNYSGSSSYGYLIKTDSIGDTDCNSQIAATLTDTLFVTTTNGFNFIPMVYNISNASINSSGAVQAITLCTTIGYNDSIIEENKIGVNPNPFYNSITIKYKSRIKRIVIRDLLGVIVTDYKVDSPEITIDTHNLSHGIYILTVVSLSGVKSEKIIKN